MLPFFLKYCLFMPQHFYLSQFLQMQEFGCFMCIYFCKCKRFHDKICQKIWNHNLILYFTCIWLVNAKFCAHENIMMWQKGVRISILTGVDALSAPVLVHKAAFTHTLKFWRLLKPLSFITLKTAAPPPIGEEWPAPQYWWSCEKLS